jgi:hypothetical protein
VTRDRLRLGALEPRVTLWRERGVARLVFGERMRFRLGVALLCVVERWRDCVEERSTVLRRVELLVD